MPPSLLRRTGGAASERKSGVGAGAINRGRPAVHHDTDADHLSRLLLAGTRADRAAGVGRDAPVQPNTTPITIAVSSFTLDSSAPAARAAPTHIAEPLVDLGSHLAQCAVLRI